MYFLQPATSYKSLGYQAYETIRDAIITLNLEPGQMVMEVELAEQLGISRTPIREAFQMLVNEQLLQVLPQRTKKISLISDVKVKESSFVRFSLESSAFQLVAEQWDANQPRYTAAEQQLQLLLKQQQEAAERQDVLAFLKLDEQFHQLILKLAGNETLLEVVYHMRGHLNRYRYLAMKEFQLTKKLVQEHSELLRTLISGDALAAKQQLEAHLNKLDDDIPLLQKKYPAYFQD